MRIGSRQAVAQQRNLNSPRTDPNAFGAGLATAMQGLGTTLQQQSEFLADREKRRREGELGAASARLRGELDREQIEAQREAPRGAPDFTNQIHERLRQRTGEFLAQIEDPDTRRRYEEQMENYVQGSTTNAFTFEFERANTAYREDVEQMTIDAQVRLKADPSAFDEVFGELETNINNSLLTAPEREELRSAVHIMLASTEYEETLRRAGTDQLPVGEPNGNDIVAPGMSAASRGFLNTTASVEATGYDVMYGGSRFEGYADHPRQAHVIQSGPYKGQNSTAAGRYQFLASTWDFVVERMTAEGYVIEDFSPANQDRAAWWYAQFRYRQRAAQLGLPPEMRELNTILASGDREQIKQLRGLLAGSADGKNVVWEGLQTISDDEFANRVLGNRGMMMGPTGSSEVPNLWDNPRYNELPFDLRMSLEQSAEQSLAQARQAAAERNRSMQQQIFQQLQTGLQEGVAGSQQAALDALRSGSLSDPELREKVRGQMGEFLTMQADAQNVTGMIGKGSAFTSEDDAAIGNFFKATGVQGGLRERDPQALQDLLVNAEQIGRIPPEITDILRAQLASANAQDQAYGAQGLAALYDQNPATFMQSHSREQAQEALGLSLALRTATNPQNAVERWNELNDPRTAGLRRELEEDARKAVTDISPADMLKATTGFLERNIGGVSLPVPDRLSQRFQAEFREMYVLGYSRTGDEKKAREYAGEMMTYSWSADPVSGGLMEFSPASAGANVDPMHDNYGWVNTQMREEFGLPEGTTAALIPDARTRAEVAAGAPPSYAVTAILEDPVSGIEEFTVIMGDNGLPRRFTAAPSETTIARRDLTLEAQHLRARLEAQRQTGQDTALTERRLQTLREEGVQLLDRRQLDRATEITPRRTEDALEDMQRGLDALTGDNR